jgi:hypothetical protein
MAILAVPRRTSIPTSVNRNGRVMVGAKTLRLAFPSVTRMEIGGEVMDAKTLRLESGKGFERERDS